MTNPVPIWVIFVTQTAELADRFSLETTNNDIAARTAMMAMTTRISVNVKPENLRRAF